MDTPARPKHRRLQLRLLNIDGRPLRNKDCLLGWGPSFAESRRTDDDGNIAWDIPMKPNEGELFIEAHKPGAASLTYKVAIAPLAKTDVPGTKARLNNLGFLSLKGPAATALDPTLDDATKRALQRFRAANSILPAEGTAGGKLDDKPTIDRLVDAHDAGGTLGKL
ncbi:MAG: hypothetical protein IAG13_26365 [Deltaproteobacteria bacterium]|nr:hypothetical protein [Nannocystaceae bacterium]